MAEKIITIGERKVRFAVNGATPVKYMALYQKDFLAEFIKLEKELQEKSIKDFMVFYQIAYLLAKTADPQIPTMEEWLETFEDGFPVFELIHELMPLIQKNFGSAQKPKAFKSKKKYKNR